MSMAIIGGVVVAGSAAYAASEQSKARKQAAANQRNTGAEIADSLGASSDVLRKQRENDYFQSYQQMEINKASAQDAIRLYPQLAQYEREMTTAQRGQDVADFRTYSPRLQKAFEKVNPGWKQAGTALQDLLTNAGERTPLLQQMNTQAMSQGPSQISQQLQQQALQELLLGGQLGADEQRAVEQQSRAAFSARGLYGGDAAAINEVMNLDGAQRARMRERQGFAGGVNAQLLAELMQQHQYSQGVEALNQQTTQQGNAAILGAAGATQARLSPLLQMLMPRTAVSPTAGAALLAGPQGNSAALLANVLGYGGDVANTNYNAAQAQAIAQANNAAALGASGVSAGTTLYTEAMKNKRAGVAA